MSQETIPRLSPLPAAFPSTGDALHRVAEQVVAPARKPHNEIALRATPGGFGTPEFERGRHAPAGAGRRGRSSSNAGARSAARHRARRPGRTAGRRAAAGGRRISRRGRSGSIRQRRGARRWYAFAAAMLARFGTAAARRRPPRRSACGPSTSTSRSRWAEAGGRRANYGVSPGDGGIAEPYPTSAPGPPRSRASCGTRPASAAPSSAYAELLADRDQPPPRSSSSRRASCRTGDDTGRSEA